MIAFYVIKVPVWLRFIDQTTSSKLILVPDTVAGMSGLAQMWVRLGPNRTNPGVSDKISVYFG